MTPSRMARSGGWSTGLRTGIDCGGAPKGPATFREAPIGPTIFRESVWGGPLGDRRLTPLWPPASAVW